MTGRGEPGGPARAVPRGVVVPSAARAVPRAALRSVVLPQRPAKPGDVVLGQVEQLGAQRQLENRTGRIHRLTHGAVLIVVHGTRYAADGFEAVVSLEPTETVDLVAPSGVVGTIEPVTVTAKARPPTRIRLLGQVVDGDGVAVNTLDHCRIEARTTAKRHPRAMLTLVCGTGAGSGTLDVAAMLCHGLSRLGHNVRASRLTGTASLSSILRLDDAGAEVVSDFTDLGHPSTHLLDRESLVAIFDRLDLRHGNDAECHWVALSAGSLLRAETAVLLAAPEVRRRIHRMVLCASDPAGALGAMQLLGDRHGLRPDVLSGPVADSPLALRELGEHTTVPTLGIDQPQLELIAGVYERRSG